LLVKSCIYPLNFTQNANIIHFDHIKGFKRKKNIYGKINEEETMRAETLKTERRKQKVEERQRSEEKPVRENQTAIPPTH